MTRFKFYRKDNYIVAVNELTQETQYGFVKEVRVDKSNLNKASYRIFNVKDFDDKNSLVIDQLLKEDGTPYTQTEFETFYTQNTGNFNGGGSAPGVQSVTGSGVDNTDPQNPIITSVEEAPEDGNQYARQDGEWSIVTGGSTPTLQQTLNGGKSAEYEGGNSFVNMLNGTADNRYFEFVSGNGTTSGSIGVDKATGYISVQDGASDAGGTVSINKDEVLLGRNFEGGQVNLVVDQPLTSESRIYHLPSGVAGNFDLAIKQDLSIQGLMDNDVKTGSIDSGTSGMTFFDGSPGARTYSFYISDGGSNSSGFSMDYDNVSLYSGGSYNHMDISTNFISVIGDGSGVGGGGAPTGGLIINSGSVNLAQTAPGFGTTSVKFNTPVTSTTLNFPAYTESGEYTIATTSDTATIEIIEDNTYIITDQPPNLMLTYTTAASNITTLPDPTLNAGKIIFFTNKLAGIITLNSILGGNDIWDGGVLTNTYPVPSGTVTRLICDGLTYNVL